MRKIIAAALFALLMPAAAMAQTIDIVPASADINVGDLFSADIAGHNFDMILDGGGFFLNFDPAVVNVLKITIADIWDFDPNPGIIDNVNGRAGEVTFATFFNSPTGDFPIATVEMTAVGGPGSGSLLELTFGVWNTFSGRPDDYSPPAPIDVELESTAITIIPEPLSLSLVFLGLGAVGVTTRKRSL